MLEKLASVGSSPRMRGTPVVPPAYPTFTGIIPAYAGNTPGWLRAYAAARDHPRICGEHLLPAEEDKLDAGSSPHMRGTRVLAMVECTPIGIIPAYAGNTGDARKRCGQ